ncbi:FIGNL1-interacting regulator of recombination and mitosis [Pezoporus flaviventris]|uniref:FIGNL1-interacting regulator of recombination and mitosis n=1 Tax=Pezoporus flaviventris TaxID=889875 RepID=UPI002AB10E3B|nr:FIGNL1-interacting regulator of recombination and mitosis [Pezoporus flaviventris]
MSQTDPELLLQELGGWDWDLCRRELPAVLPRLLSMYQESQDWNEHVRVLRILTEMFLPHISLADLEQTFFSKVLPKTLQLFDNLMYELYSEAKGLTSQNTELCNTVRNLLQTLVQLLETLTGCVRYVCTLQECVPLESIRTLPASVLYVVKNTFTHCKDSESVYCGQLHLISDLLQAMFKEAYSLQKQLMELLDTISMGSASTEDNITDMVSVIHTVLEICSVISNMDHALHANTWKFIIKQSLKHHSLLQCHLKHSDILSGLCNDTLLSFHSCLQLAEQMKISGIQEGTDLRLFQKTVKLCRFFANSLVHYTKEFLSFFSDSCSQLHQLFLQIYSKFPPSLYAPEISEVHRDEISRVFLVALDPLINQLLPFSPFMEQVLSEKLGLPPEQQLPQCLILITIMDKLSSQPEEVQTLWNTGKSLSLFSALFFSFQQCSGELSLPVCLPEVISTGQLAAPITLYHYVCVHLCSFIASTLPSHFPRLEYALLDAVLGSSMITSLLAMDSWCFLARYGTAELCAHHVAVIAHLIKSWPSDCYEISALGILLRRMLFLMAPDHQAKFAHKFVPEEVENLAVWQHISLKALNPDLRKRVACQLCVAGLTQCRQWLNSRRALGELRCVNTALSVLLAACSFADDTLEAELQTSVLGVLGQFWTFLQAKQVSDEPCLQQTVCLLLHLLEFFVQALDAQLITQVFSLQSSLFQLDPPDHVRLAMVDFLSSMGKVFIPQEAQRQVVPQLSCVFASLLADQTWLIHQHALEAFTHFAEETSHEDVVPQCLDSEETKNKVISFLAKTRQVEETTEARTERMKQERITCSAQLMKMGAELESTGEPLAKRACHPPSEEQYKSAIGTMEGAVEAVKLLLQKGSPPAWLAVKLEALHTAIAILRDSVR